MIALQSGLEAALTDFKRAVLHDERYFRRGSAQKCGGVILRYRNC